MCVTIMIDLMMASWPGPQTMTPPCFMAGMRFFSWNADLGVFPACPPFCCPNHSVSIQKYIIPAEGPKVSSSYTSTRCTLSNCRGMNFHLSLLPVLKGHFRGVEDTFSILLSALGWTDRPEHVISNVLHLDAIHQASGSTS